jgi:hypothetical protein
VFFPHNVLLPARIVIPSQHLCMTRMQWVAMATANDEERVTSLGGEEITVELDTRLREVVKTQGLSAEEADTVLQRRYAELCVDDRAGRPGRHAEETAQVVPGGCDGVDVPPVPFGGANLLVVSAFKVQMVGNYSASPNPSI